MRWCYLGLVAYHEALALQERLRAAVSEDRCGGTLLLLQHPKVITLGRSARETNVLISHEEMRRRGVEIAKVSRGGDVTYHGPGQLVGYPIRRVGRSVRPHVQAMAEGIVHLLAELGIDGWWREDLPGVWCPAGKIAAVGVDARGGVAMHGFAFNIRPDLVEFQMIVPCGLQAPVTSLEAVLGEAAAPSVEEMARRMAHELCRRYQTEEEEISLAQIEEPLK